jgi:hypothetical protein
MSAPAQAWLAIFRKSGGPRKITPSKQLRVLGIINPQSTNGTSDIWFFLQAVGCRISKDLPMSQNFQKFQEKGTQLHPAKCKKGRITRLNCKDELCPLLESLRVALAPLYWLKPRSLQRQPINYRPQYGSTSRRIMNPRVQHMGLPIDSIRAV